MRNVRMVGKQHLTPLSSLPTFRRQLRERLHVQETTTSNVKSTRQIMSKLQLHPRWTRPAAAREKGQVAWALPTARILVGYFQTTRPARNHLAA